MYSGKSYVIDITVGGKWVMTHRATEQSIKNKMEKDNKSFTSACYGLLSSNIYLKVKRDPDKLEMAFNRPELRKCIETGSAKFDDVEYTPTVSESTGFMASNAAREFIR